MVVFLWKYEEGMISTFITFHETLGLHSENNGKSLAKLKTTFEDRPSDLTFKEKNIYCCFIFLHIVIKTFVIFLFVKSVNEYQGS